MIEFIDFKVLAWNVRGAVNVKGQRHMRDLIKRFHPNVVIVIETHTQFTNVRNFWNNLGYTVEGLVEAQGFLGGIWMLTSGGSFSCTLVDCFHQCVTVEVGCGDKKWVSSAIYASPIPTIRSQLWDYLARLRNSISHPWILMGDFNDILLPSEVKGGAFYASRAKAFTDMMENCQLVDMGAYGNKFTWFRSGQNSNSIAKRLDRALADINWRNAFPDAFVENLPRLQSDHSPIVLHCGGSIPPKALRPFHFQAAWIGHAEYGRIVQEAWNKGNRDVIRGLNEVRQDSLSFNKDTFGNIFRRKRSLENRIANVQKSLEQWDSLSLENIEKDLRREYDKILAQEELLWFQKSRENWVQFGDRNTKVLPHANHNPS